MYEYFWREIGKTKHGKKDRTANYMKHLMNQTLLHRVKRLAWAGHLVPINNNRILKQKYPKPSQME